MKKSTVLSLTTAAVILAAYVPNEVVLADTSSSEDALNISDKEKVVGKGFVVIVDRRQHRVGENLR